MYIYIYIYMYMHIYIHVYIYIYIYIHTHINNTTNNHYAILVELPYASPEPADQAALGRRARRRVQEAVAVGPNYFNNLCLL